VVNDATAAQLIQEFVTVMLIYAGEYCNMCQSALSRDSIAAMGLWSAASRANSELHNLDKRNFTKWLVLKASKNYLLWWLFNW